MATVDTAALFPSESDSLDSYRPPGATDQREYLIGGAIRQWQGAMQEVLSPVCLRTPEGLRRVPLGRYPLLTAEESMKALDAAAAAYDSGRGRWPTMPVAERIRHVEDLAIRMAGLKDEIVRWLMWEIGKPLADSRREFDRTLEYIQGTIDALKDLDRTGSRFTIQEGIIAQIRRAPLGVALCMGPFNYPLNETFTVLIPALIMGNTVVLKPPKHGVLLFRCLLEALRDAFPSGVVNTVYGKGEEVIPPLLASGRVDVLAFIGTSRVADQLKKLHPRPHRLRCILGLDAKNPAILLPDTDIGLAVRECLLGTLSFNGQRCTALKILFVHRKIAGSFLERFCAAADLLRCGMPWDDGVAITPLPEPGKPEYLEELIADAIRAGARVVNGGHAVAGTMFRPAVLDPVDRSMRVYNEEQFGPVVAIAPFDSIEEPIRFIVESNYGQQVALFGRDPIEMARLIDPLVNQVCRVNLNSQCQRGPDTFPFTGRKDSAEGTLSVSDALRVFSIRTLVAAKNEPLNREILTEIVRQRRSGFLSTDFIF
jgi:glyceraldehyde-3-phosphate dehydrogenase (NADP+)